MKATLSLVKKLTLAGGVTAGLLTMSAVPASASPTYTYDFGGEVMTQHCYAHVVSYGSSWTLAVGTVEGDSNCSVYLSQRNINTGGTTTTNWSTNQTSPLYHNDGVHQVRVTIWDGTSGVGGSGIWVN